MAWGVSVRVERNLFPRMPANLRRYYAGATSDSAGAIQAGARQRAPVATGALWQGIQVVPEGDARYTVVSEREGGPPDVPTFVEYGTRFMAARPYFRPAIEAERPRFEADTRDLETALLSGRRRRRR